MYKIIKLTNGTEVIGDVLFNTKDENIIAIDKPMMINYKTFQNAILPSISLIRYSLLASNEPIIFSMKDVMNVIEPRQLFVDYYTSTVDTAFNHYDEVVDRELGMAIDRHKEDEESEEDQYTFLLNNFESGTIN